MANFTVCGDPERRHDFIMLFDVTDGNPNGDPDAGNMPRTDPETLQGLVTDVCLKRKVRNYVTTAKNGVAGYEIYVNERGIALNTLHEEGYAEANIKSTGTKQNRDDIDKVRKIMCKRFYDVRSFGAVMTTGRNAGQVRGPFQLTFARSVDPIVPLDETITRVAITKPEDAQVVESEEGADGKGKGKTTEMGRKAIVPYGLYLAHGFYTPAFAKQTGVSREDLELFWTALTMMWDLDHSAARGLMSIRGLHVFSHENALGNVPAHKLFDKLKIEKVPAPRRFDDYVVTLNRDMPDGVTLTSLVDG
ncbi:MAG: type I-C CRISPR-associated protein Cas7/Csd2 [Capsulimonadaceae bacterium]|nr:type I-C CRISPR-associated protein Cas7/Csd2 [Capsulimonadaceae bacterium]